MTNDDTVLEIRYSRVKCALILVFIALCIYAPLWLLKFNPNDILNSVLQSAKEQEKGWAALAFLIFFGLCFLFYLKAILDRRIQIRSDKNGLYLRRGLNQTIPWRDIDDIYLTSGFSSSFSKWFPMVSYVNLTVKNPSKYKQTGLTGLLSAPSKILSGGDFHLAPMLFEISRKSLLDALQSAHQKYASIPNSNSKDKQ